ncbi:hypothetical protein JKS91_14680, partial [Listeria monocytogenes]|nr:hypothetical protein [Listeria monocytogenes]
MLFDLSTNDKAKETLATFLRLDLEKLETLLEEYSDDEPTECIKNYIPKDAQAIAERSTIKFFHITTTIDGFASVKENGLLGLEELLSTNSSFTNFLKKNNIDYNENKQTLLIEEKEIDINQEDWNNVKQRITFDFNINGFYFIDDSNKNYSSVNKRPEFFFDLDTVLNGKYNLSDKWEKLSKSYLLEIEISWKDWGPNEVIENFNEMLEI